MLTIGCKIIIISESTSKKITFDYANAIEVVTSIADLTDTAVVKVSQKMQWRGQSIREFINPGDSIEIQAGYEEYGYQTLFKGYLRKVETTKIPMELHCENEMARLKGVMLKPKIYKNFDLAQFFRENCPGIKVVSPATINFGEVTVANEMSMAEFLNGFKQKYAYFKPFFIGNELYAISRTYTRADTKPITLDPTRNIVSDNLTYIRKEDVKVSVKATSIQKDNTKLEVTVPDDSKNATENKHFYLPGYTDIKSLKEEAQKILDSFKCDKMTGTVTTFGVPYIRKCDLVLLHDEDHPERNNRKFTVNAVTYTISTSGYRQKITLGDEIK